MRVTFIPVKVQELKPFLGPADRVWKLKGSYGTGLTLSTIVKANEHLSFSTIIMQ